MTNRSEYMQAWWAAHAERKAEYARRYRRRLKQYPRAADAERQNSRERQRRRRSEIHDVLLIQERMRRRGRPVDIQEARLMLREFGPDYPLHRGLNDQQRRWLRRVKDREGRQGAERHQWLVFEAYEQKPKVKNQNGTNRNERNPQVQIHAGTDCRVQPGASPADSDVAAARGSEAGSGR